MNPDRWREVSRIYGAVLTRPESDRPTALADLCANDVELRREVESLLASGTGAALLDRVVTDRPSVMAMANGMTIGSTIGVFRIDALLGVGGMGEVYRARDAKLNRDVAIKILPPAFASDPDRLARFKREAQVLASLNHPNIGGIHGFEDASGIHALVLELVEGPTLADRIARGRLPVEEALAITRQIADALEAAHEQGIIHRDLKPANIKIRDDGTVKVLDFGLAKIAEAPGSRAQAPDLTRSPTITTPATTAAGMILGTAAYMSPEQAKGKPADKRSDIWAFGVVLYEMLTGERPFKGEDVADTLAAILRGEPDWQALPASTPQLVRRLLHRCLAKERKNRLPDAAALRLDLGEASASPSEVGPPSRAPRPAHLVTAALMGAVAAAAVAYVVAVRAPSPPIARMQFDLATPPSREPASFAVSPNGDYIAYVADAEERSQLWVRDLRSGVAHVIEGTVGPRLPFWSPNSRSIGFMAQGRLKSVELAGGAPRDLAASPGGRWGATWGTGVIVFVPTNTAGLTMIPEDGGTTKALTRVVPPQLSHRSPSFLPDLVHLTFVVLGPPGTRGLYLTDTTGTVPRRLFDADTGAAYVNGHLIFVRDGVLLAQAFDASRLEVHGDAFRVADRVNFANGVAAVSGLEGGTLIFRGGIPGDRRQMIWFDRAGHQLQALSTPDVGGATSGVELSPDGKRLVSSRQVAGNQTLWTLEMSRGIWSVLSPGLVGSQGNWSPDGGRLAFVRTVDGSTQISVRPSSADGSETALVQTEDLKGTNTWTHDGATLLYNRVPRGAPSDVWAVNVATKKTYPVATTGAAELDSQLSTDDRWVAYQSDGSGLFEIYVQPFGRPGDRIQVTSGGGAQVRWRRDGRELYYIDLEERLIAVPIPSGTGGESIEFGAPRQLFRLRMPGGVLQAGGNHQQYLPSEDGERFLVNVQLEEPDQAPLSVILNWDGSQAAR